MRPFRNTRTRDEYCWFAEFSDAQKTARADRLHRGTAWSRIGSRRRRTAADRALDFKKVKSLLSAPILVDLRNVYSRDTVEAEGFSYHAVGR